METTETMGNEKPTEKVKKNNKFNQGRYTKEEEAIIKKHSDLDFHELAKLLNRDPYGVKNYLESKNVLNNSNEKEIEATKELRNKPYWGELQGQFSREELAKFCYHWKKLWSQFKDDVYHTEEMQIIDMIKFEILMNRDLTKQTQITNQMMDAADQLLAEKNKDKDDQDRDLLMNLERQVAILGAAQEAVSKDYRDLQEKKQKIIQALKGTREQRIKDTENSKVTFSGFMKQINQSASFRRNIGIEMEKMRLAMYKEKERLSKEHRYEDGDVDQPILTSETVL